ncbi:hypothetical protein CANINC_004882 [Pichia inconspicua]|uniref:Uncharacterized protein n=1 Tax=Pichia inconspicua TaxID=52247 RepID=A0A4T0WV11_9ASCO|nr:hypothetical protein CANINC_004882 [[Candida] inconspicua]
MDVYFVKPNLQILSCDSCPTEENLVIKKTLYLSLLNKCSQLQQMSGSDSKLPSWCTNDPQTSNDMTSSSSTPSVESLNNMNMTRSPKTTATPKCFLKHMLNDSQNNRKDPSLDILTFPLQSVKLTPEDCYRKNKITDTIFFTRLNLPTNISSADRKWLALKYLQLSADVALLQYKYLKSYTKINKLVKKYFSKPQISESEEANGFRCISYEMDKFKSLENVLTFLTHLQDKFQTHFSNINIANVPDTTIAAVSSTASTPSCR